MTSHGDGQEFRDAVEAYSSGGGSEVDMFGTDVGKIQTVSGGPRQIMTNPSRPDLSTPAGLGSVESLVQRAVMDTSRRGRGSTRTPARRLGRSLSPSFGGSTTANRSAPTGGIGQVAAATTTTGTSDESTTARILSHNTVPGTSSVLQPSRSSGLAAGKPGPHLAPLGSEARQIGNGGQQQASTSTGFQASSGAVSLSLQGTDAGTQSQPYSGYQHQPSPAYTMQTSWPSIPGWLGAVTPPSVTQSRTTLPAQRIRTAIPSYRNCTIGESPMTPGLSFNYPFNQQSGWAQAAAMNYGHVSPYSNGQFVQSGITATPVSSSGMVVASQPSPHQALVQFSQPMQQTSRASHSQSTVQNSQVQQTQPSQAVSRVQYSRSTPQTSQSQYYHGEQQQLQVQYGHQSYLGQQPITQASTNGFDKFSTENYANTYGHYTGEANGSGYGSSSPYGHGMPSHIKNAVRMLPPFYSDNTTVDKARTFWDAFERATFGLSDPLRLSVFRDRLKGSSGENWWMYSQIDDFETLKTRFHNQFVCQTPQQMIERLKTTKRSRGMSAEVWGDLISGLCDAAQCFDPQMRYQYFLAGIRNKEWRSALATTMVNSIPQAVAVLLYKNLHLPVEDESEFMEGPTSQQVPENAMMQRILELIESTQAVQQQLLNPSRQTRRNTVAAAIPTQPLVQNAPVYLPTAPQAHEVPFYQSVNTAFQQSSSRGIRPDPDLRTQEGVIVCGRCRRVGHGRLSCGRNNLNCNKCHMLGHIAPECEQVSSQQQFSNSSSGPSQSISGAPIMSSSNGRTPYSRACFLCKATDHLVANCPSRAAFDQMVSRQSNGVGAPQGQPQAQN